MYEYVIPKAMESQILLIHERLHALDRESHPYQS